MDFLQHVFLHRINRTTCLLKTGRIHKIGAWNKPSITGLSPGTLNIIIVLNIKLAADIFPALL